MTVILPAVSRMVIAGKNIKPTAAKRREYIDHCSSDSLQSPYNRGIPERLHNRSGNVVISSARANILSAGKAHKKMMMITQYPMAF